MTTLGRGRRGIYVLLLLQKQRLATTGGGAVPWYRSFQLLSHKHCTIPGNAAGYFYTET